MAAFSHCYAWRENWDFFLLFLRGHSCIVWRPHHCDLIWPWSPLNSLSQAIATLRIKISKYMLWEDTTEDHQLIFQCLFFPQEQPQMNLLLSCRPAGKTLCIHITDSPDLDFLRKWKGNSCGMVKGLNGCLVVEEPIGFGIFHSTFKGRLETHCYSIHCLHNG